MSRSVALIDADTTLLAQISSELAGLGLRCEALIDANELLQRTEAIPDLIVLCIDPKRTGWAVCNRLRKSPQHKSVPLIITSEEATAKDFEDHRKLKTRAEDYLHKPFTPRDVAVRVCQLLGLPIPSAHDEVSLDDEIAVEEEVLVEEEGNDLLNLDDESTRVGMRFEADAQAEVPNSFDAMMNEHTQRGISRDQVAQMIAGGKSPSAPMSAAAVVAKAAAPAPAPAPAHKEVAHGFSDNPITGVIKIPEAPSTGLAAELDLDAVAKQASDEPPRPRKASSPFSVNVAHVAPDTRALETEVQNLRSERDRLQEDLDKARRTPATATSVDSKSREKDFLSLREVINKKEREVLDLREALDARDRQILDSKDRVRESERKSRDVDERLLEVERLLMAATERAEELQQQVETASDRERQLKAKIDEAQRAAQTQIDTAGQKQAQAFAQREGEFQAQLTAANKKSADELAALKAQFQNELSAAEAKRLGELASLEGKRARELQLADERRLAELGQAEEQRSRDLTEADKRHQAEIGTVVERHRQQLAATEQKLREEAQLDKAQELAVLEKKRQADAATVEQRIKQESEGQLAKLREEHEATLAQLRAEGEQRAQAMREELASQQAELSAEIESLQSGLQQAEQQRQELTREHEAQRAALAAEWQVKVQKAQSEALAEIEIKLADERRNHETQIGLIEQSRAQAEATLAAQHAADRSAKQSEHEEELELKDAELASLTAQLEEARRLTVEHSTKATELTTRLAELTARDQEQGARITELEKLADRVLADAAAADRARRALAVAVALLDQIAPDSDKTS